MQGVRFDSKPSQDGEKDKKNPYEELDRIPRGVQLDSDRSPCGI